MPATRKINPFRPNSPVNPGMFAGRLSEINALIYTLIQTRAGQAKNFMVTGKRGIGKTSLLDYIRWVARGDLDFDGDTFKFLVVTADIGPSTTQLGLVKRIETGLRRELAETEQARQFLTSAWNFVSRFEAAGMRFRDRAGSNDPELMLDEFAYSVAETVKRICDVESAPIIFGTQYDGVLLMLDECDNASDDLQLGVFLKLLLEQVQRHDCNNFMVGIAGLNNLHDILHESHPSSLRLFDEYSLDRLNNDEISMVIDLCLDRANEMNHRETAITENAKKLLAKLSEGYPHFIQQLGYCAFAQHSDNTIGSSDVLTGALGDRGAIELIGARYYKHDFYHKIQNENYRQVLRIMADHEGEWVSKAYIRKAFSGKETTLSNALLALRERKIILSKQGARGVYRLQNRAFALWMNLYTVEPAELELLKVKAPLSEDEDAQ